MQIILGSASPRRKEILNCFSLPFRVEVPNIDEDAIPFNGDVPQYVTEIAQEKGKVLLRKFPDSLIITADTTVYFNGKVYNKPANEQEAFDALSALAGNCHEVYTAICVTTGDKQETRVDKTKVFFKQLNSNEIRLYQQAVHCYDKAGGYAIQGAGCLIVDRIDGDYTNVVGFPVHVLIELLKNFNVNLWDYL